MKNHFLLYKMVLILLVFTIINSEAQDSLVSVKVVGHIVKPKKAEPTNEKISSLDLPAGFQISTFAEGLGKPRMIIVGPNENVYVSRREPGDVILLKDTNGDGKADKRQTVIKKENAHGLTIYEGNLYLVTVKEVYRGEILKDGSIGKMEKIIEDLPDGGQHPNRTLAFGPDGQLYISVGSTCNACGETDKENATLLIADENGNKRNIYAKGLRNTIGFDWHPKTGELYGMDHGIDWLGDEEQKEELNHIQKGNNYGWPYIYADGKYNEADSPPNTSWEEYASQTTKPVLLHTAHSAPMDLIFYKGNMFPEEYRNSAFVTFHGSWNRKPPSGYNVKLVRFEKNEPEAFEEFLSGFLSSDQKSQFGRPVGLAEHPDGSILITDDSNGNIYRVTYQL